MNDEGQRQDLHKRTKEFVLRVVRLYTRLPKAGEAQVIGKQLLRSGTSVSTHYREGFRARSTAEFIRKLGDGQQELEESTYWMELQSEAEELMAIFASCIIAAKQKKQNTSKLILHTSSFPP